MKILFTCGGTAGHINPAVALARLFQERSGAEVLFVGAKGGMEERLVPKEGFALETVTISSFWRSVSPASIKHNLTTHKKLSYLTMLGLRKGENEYTYAACTKQQAEELIRGLREIAPYVVIDCSSYIANDILSAVALMEADSVLRLANCDLKSIGYLSSQLPLLRELHWDEDKQYKAASNIKPLQAADRIGQVLGSVAFKLPYSQELEEQYLEGTLLNDLSMKDSKAFRREIEKICKEVF